MINEVPLFQLCSFLTRTSPLGLKGPFSENAPTPREEQPGPVQNKNKLAHLKVQGIFKSIFELKYIYKCSVVVASERLETSIEPKD